MNTLLCALGVLCLAALGAWLLTPPVARLGSALAVVDRPGARRVRSRAVPTTGGIAVFCSFGISMIIARRLCPLLPPELTGKLAALLAGGTAIVILGIFDDKVGLRPQVKLGMQFAIALAMVASGVGISQMRVLFGPTMELGWLSYPLTVFWFVAFMNALNLIDGLDGLAGGIAAIAAGALIVVGVVNYNPLLYVMCAALLGSTLGFLLHNFPKGNIYLGDSGSMVLGFFIAGASIIGSYNDGASKALLIAAACMAVPAFDVATTITRRVSARRGIMTPDQSHLHHRLIRFGLAPKMTVVVLWGATVFFGGQMLGLIAPYGLIYILASYATAGFVAYVIRQQRRKNMRTTERKARAELFYLIGARDGVDGETDEEEPLLREIIRDQRRREVRYRKLVRDEARAEHDPSPERAGPVRTPGQDRRKVKVGTE